MLDVMLHLFPDFSRSRQPYKAVVNFFEKWQVYSDPCIVCLLGNSLAEVGKISAGAVLFLWRTSYAISLNV